MRLAHARDQIHTGHIQLDEYDCIQNPLGNHTKCKDYKLEMIMHFKNKLDAVSYWNTIVDELSMITTKYEIN